MAFLLCRDVLVRALKWMLQRVALQATYSAGTFTVLLGWGAGRTGEDPSSFFWGLRITYCTGSTRAFAMRLVLSGGETAQQQLLDV